MVCYRKLPGMLALPGRVGVGDTAPVSLPSGKIAKELQTLFRVLGTKHGVELPVRSTRQMNARWKVFSTV